MPPILIGFRLWNLLDMVKLNMRKNQTNIFSVLNLGHRFWIDKQIPHYIPLYCWLWLSFVHNIKGESLMLAQCSTVNPNKKEQN